jgi:hypothetical protein
VRWPGQSPTHGVEAHKQEALAFFRTFPDQHLDNRPYKVFFASGDFCTVARWDDGQIVEEDLFYDLVTFMRQLGLSG